jgi:tRNA-binding EMAP/Myf-like protein
VGEDAAAVTEKKIKAPQQPVVETTWNTLVVGEIVDFHAHPQADRLNVCAVNVGDKDNLLQIICGAPNVRQGARVPVAKVGTRLAIKEPETGELYVCIGLEPSMLGCSNLHFLRTASAF